MDASKIIVQQECSLENLRQIPHSNGCTSHTTLYSWLFLNSTESDFSTTIERQNAGFCSCSDSGRPKRHRLVSVGHCLWASESSQAFVIFGLSAITSRTAERNSNNSVAANSLLKFPTKHNCQTGEKSHLQRNVGREAVPGTCVPDSALN